VGVQADVRRFVDDWIRAEARGDVTSLSRLLNDDFFAVQPDGSIIRRKEWLQRYQRSTLVHDTLRLSTLLHLDHPHLAVIVGGLSHVSSFGGHPVSGTKRVTMVIDLDPSPRLTGLHLAESIG
jgi:uncharacterized protein DUF4440